MRFFDFVFYAVFLASLAYWVMLLSSRFGLELAKVGFPIETIEFVGYTIGVSMGGGGQFRKKFHHVSMNDLK